MGNQKEHGEAPEKTPEELEAERLEAEKQAKLLKEAEENLDDLSKEDLAAALIKLNSTHTQVSARLTKADAALKDPDYLAWKESKKKSADLNKDKKEEPANVGDEIDLRFLQRDGASEEDIKQLRFIQAAEKSQGRTISLIEAKNHNLYKAYEFQKAEEERKNKAQLAPGGGSGYSEETQKVADMPEEDHKKFAKEKANKILGRQ